MNAVIRAAHIEGRIGTSFHTVRSGAASLCLNASVYCYSLKCFSDLCRSLDCNICKYFLIVTVSGSHSGVAFNHLLSNFTFLPSILCRTPGYCHKQLCCDGVGPSASWGEELKWNGVLRTTKSVTFSPNQHFIQTHSIIYAELRAVGFLEDCKQLFCIGKYLRKQTQPLYHEIPG